MSSFQQNIRKYAKIQDSMIHSQEKLMETVPEKAQMLNLLGQRF